MELLLSALSNLPEYGRLTAALKKNKHAAVSGVAQINRSHLIAALFRELERPMVVVCQDELAATRTAAELGAFLGKEPPVLPQRELTFYDSAAVSRGWEQKRLRQLYELRTGETALQVVTWDALSLRTMPKDVLLSAAIELHQSQQCHVQKLINRLTLGGYSRCSLVEGVGQFALRGGILDVFSPWAEQPVRIDFFGDEIDVMGFFDPLTQRRTQNTEKAILLPVCETQPQLHPGSVEGLAAELRALSARLERRKSRNEPLLKTLATDTERIENRSLFAAADRYMSLIYPNFTTAADYFPDDAVVVLCDHGNLRRAANRRVEELGMELDSYLQEGLVCGELCDFMKDWDDECRELRGHPAVFLDSFLPSAYPEGMAPAVQTSMTAKQLPSYGGNLELAANDLSFYQKNEYSSLVLCGNRRRAESLEEFLYARGVRVHTDFPLTRLPRPGEVLLTEGSLPNGMDYPELKLAVLTEGQLLAKPERRAKLKKKVSNRQKLNSFTDLTPGDYIVHETHGIGKYLCMEQIKTDGVVKDYVKIGYQGSDVLYVPATQLDMISKYIGAGEESPVRVNRLGGDSWEKAKSRAKGAVKELAQGLIKLYAERKRCLGFAFSEDSPWQQEFENTFPYAETDDQLRCIAEVKADMQAPAPMDRLLCGDVGFGKTEVALRAVMKAILDGKQAAILVPTTVLAQQHYVTAMRRFGDFPVNVEVLSRFRSAKQQKKALEGLRAGSVDLVIGTHKLLQKDIVFKDLGLLVVDEEQRFGVSHKEKLKELSRGVDVLTLSATPIPRTLNMAMSGIRDMSTIEEPPQDRYPVQTFVLEQNEGVLLDAIRRELGRGGQVYYLHNRVESIERCAARLLEQLPDAQLAVAHGKMNEEQLGDVMQRMADGEIDVLVCTTIIETGIDIPNVNTLIIEDADKLGLAQLHQIRGRVGRSNRHAFAYLTFRRGKVLSEVAEKRLNAIREFAEFGSGFKIAMRDLEIRGAGNLLGADQSGHMLSVGYDMYLKLLEEAVLEEQGLPAVKTAECTADLDVSASIDKSYVTSGEQRMDLYRRMAAIRSKEDADELLDEIVDRYSDPPKGVMNLIAIALLRARAAAVDITDISQKGGEVIFTLSAFDFQVLSEVCALKELKGRIFVTPTAEKPTIRIRLCKGEDGLKLSEFFVSALERHFLQKNAIK